MNRYLGTLVDVATILPVIRERVPISALAREGADSVTAATVATDTKKQAALVNI